MEQRDYLLRQIEMMAQVLVALIRKLTGLKEEGSEEELHVDTNEMLKEHLDTDLDAIMKIQPDKLSKWILAKNGMDKKNLELFAEVLVLNAKAMTAGTESKKLLEAALTLYLWADKNGDTYSVERHSKMNEIKTLLYA
jgi:hypothetical protein